MSLRPKILFSRQGVILSLNAEKLESLLGEKKKVKRTNQLTGKAQPATVQSC